MKGRAVADGVTACRLFFGGGSRPAGALRNLLREKIEAVPPGGTIDWVTYYLRDYDLARTLAAARRRGVRVTVTVEARPRTGHANREVADFLASPEGLGSGFRELSLPGPPGEVLHPRLHGKLYCFSDPRPVALVGSFNPSGNAYGNPSGRGRGENGSRAAGLECEQSILAEIGDQDRGYNLLVELSEMRLVRALSLHARWLNRLRPYPGLRADLYLNRHLRGRESEIFFWPRLRPHPVLKKLRAMGPGTRVRLVASHLRGGGIVRRLLALARQGIELEILAEATERRVPGRVEERFRAAGIRFDRVGLDTGLPMHDKFLLAEREGERLAAFGSFNWTPRSFWCNYEIGVIAKNPELFAAFAARWHELEARGRR